MTEDEHEMIRRVHDWLFKPNIEGKPPRAELLDDVMTAIRAGKLWVRVLLYLMGAIAAFSAAWASVKGWIR